MKVGDVVRHITYDWIGVVVGNDIRGVYVWWSGWSALHNPDGPMQELWLRKVNEER